MTNNINLAPCSGLYNILLEAKTATTLSHWTLGITEFFFTVHLGLILCSCRQGYVTILNSWG